MILTINELEKARALLVAGADADAFVDAKIGHHAQRAALLELMNEQTATETTDTEKQ